jgi:hypothetical protein
VPNAVQILVEKSQNHNGRLNFFFGGMAGMSSTDVQAQATAALVREIAGFRAPHDGSNFGFLPIALDEETWNQVMAGNTSDRFAWNEETQTISGGGDGILECSLYPTGTGAPGNRGTVDVGGSNNSTSDIARQVLHGVSEEDLAYHGGSLEFNQDGVLFLNGDTGISAGIADELNAIKGQPRVIPIFREVNGPGNNAEYTIVKFVGIRILRVKLTGKMKGKEVVIQPAPVVVNGVIPASSGSNTSDFVYSNVVLVK